MMGIRTQSPGCSLSLRGGEQLQHQCLDVEVSIARESPVQAKRQDLPGSEHGLTSGAASHDAQLVLIRSAGRHLTCAIMDETGMIS